MTYILIFLVQGLLVGLVVVASNPSPYFAALGLVVVAGMGCGVVVLWDGMFLSLILFLIYLGGMLVVFAYSSALASELYPEALGSPRVAVNFLMYVGGLLIVVWIFLDDLYIEVEVMWDEVVGASLVRGDQVGVSFVYQLGGWGLVLAAWVLLLTLFVVLEVVRGGSRGALRPV